MASSQTAKPIAYPYQPPRRRIACEEWLELLNGWRGADRERSTVFRKQFSVAQPRPNAKVIANAMPRRSRPTQRNEPSGFPRPQARNAQNFQRNYERYLALARAEALAGDRIVAENYFQHAEHYFRSMRPA
jgi:hypothetical protein